MSKTLYVVNPNCNVAVTQGIDAALEGLRESAGPVIKCVTLEEGPPGIQSQRDVDRAAVLVRDFAEAHSADAAGFITACFSDPGLLSLREMPNVLSLGISECAALTAMTLGPRFGVIAILDVSIPRHMRAWASMGISSRVAGEVAIGRTVAQLADKEATLEAMIKAGKVLRDTYSADVLVMGCAGMASFRASLESAVGLPVVEPSQAAVAMAISRLKLGW